MKHSKNNVMNFGHALGRSEMKKIMAGSCGTNAIYCYCCDGIHTDELCFGDGDPMTYCNSNFACSSYGTTCSATYGETEKCPSPCV